MCVHVVASGLSARMLQKAELNPAVRLYASTEELAEYISPSSEDLTSRWMPPGSDDQELPLAA